MFNWIDKFVYHIKETVATEDQDGNMIMAPMKKATGFDVMMALIKLVMIITSVILWAPSVLGIFFLFNFTPLHTLVAIVLLVMLIMFDELWHKITDKEPAPVITT